MNIVVLAGGLSPERDVSLSSGTMACNALLGRGHRAILVDLFFGVPEWDGTERIFSEAKPLPPYRVAGAEPDLRAIAASRKEGYNEWIGSNVPALCRFADIVFMGLHGDCGENGKLQALFDSLGVRYTGSGAKACALAMDKDAAKRVFAENGILCPDGFVHRAGEPLDLASVPLPCVVKPLSGGSSIGVSIVREREALASALDAALSVEPQVLIETFVRGRELSCGVLGDTVLPPIEIIPREGFYDYKNKYQAGATEEITPARIPPETARRMQALTRRGFDALGLSVYGRLDFLLTADGDIFCLEANTLPGLTPTSLIPQEAAAIGIDYPTLCERIVALSLEKTNG